MGVRFPLPAPSKIPISSVESEACRARQCAVLWVLFESALLQGTSSGTVRIHCHFNILAPLAADFISADYPYLRQIRECAADLVIGLLERRFLGRMSHRLHST